MCTVEKLLIKGVRSFSPDNQNVIEFYRPLTLIVGSNGAGKTTIIECLKQACTGELPPNTKSGQSFIHDPKVAGETEVKAQIKLRFRTATGAPVVVCRSFQLSQKKAGLQFKTLDSVLQTYNKDTGAKQAITYRCADMDRMVPGLMGVSKAILENVIFVHQEDSNWPLAEGKVLKAKFDDIFAATKYTKALDAFRKLKTEKTQELKEAKLKLENLKTHKDAAHKLRSQIASGRSNVAAAEAEISELRSKMEEIESQMAALDAKLDRITAINEGQAKIDAQLSVIQRQAAEQMARLTVEFEEPTEEMEEWLARYDSQLRERQAEAAELSRQAGSKRLEAEALKEQYSKACKRHGRLAAEAEAHAANLRARDALIRDTASRLAIPLHAAPPLHAPAGAPPPPLPPSAVEAFAAELSARASELARELSEAKAANRRQDESLTGEVDKANAALSRASETRRMKQEQLQQLQRSADGVAAELSSCAVDESAIAELSGQVEAANQLLLNKQREMEQARYDEQLAAVRSDLEELARKMQELRGERDRASAVGDAAAALRLKRQELASKRAELDALLTSKRAPLQQLLGGAQLPPPAGIKAAADAAVARQRGELDKLKAKLQQAEAKKRGLESELAAKTSEMGRLHLSTQQLAEDLRAGLAQATLLPEAHRRVEAFDAALQEMDQIKDRSVHLAIAVRAQRSALAVHIEMAVEEKGCPVCHRCFDTTNLFDDFLATLRAEVEADPKTLADKEEEATRATEQAAALRALRPKASSHAQQAAALPAMRARVGELQQQVAAAEAEVQSLAEEEALSAAELDRCARLAGEVGWQAAALDRAIGELEKQVSDLERRAAASAAAGRSVADVDADLGEVEARRSHREVDREQLLRKQAKARDEVMALNVRVAELGQELMRQQGRVRRRGDLQRRLDDIARQQADAAEAAEAAGREAAPLTAARDAAVERRTAARAAAAQREGAVDARIREVASARDAVAARCRPIDEYGAGGAEGDLQRVAAETEALNRRIEEAHRAVDEMERALARKQEGLNTLSETRRDIVATLDCRRTSEKQRSLEQQLAQLETQKAQIGDHPSLTRQYEGLQRQRGELQSRQDMAKGRVEVERQSLRAAEGELQSPQFSNIDTKTRAMMVQVSTTRLAAEDLEKYHRALEKALLAFHTTKMADINKTVKELWQKTYRGQDIDSIQIKADADGARSYAYRVVMYQGGVELDMRGRCSAGQKVLASLVIRLALAENFCLNCGILALDEPTTNLDAANAAALAEALRTVMASRRDQENFQLIVITHDEAFAAQIGTRQHADYLWRVTKDEAQHSHVAQEDIGD
ncbi:DNA repair protein [Raphidocelis subcapitata]|uniref:DNA repair protein RAD50 n=1 Tax=Raphidocelis subcapitata TaxID=307507 RepID=A0A2V0P5T3_9CHLO|nr:DNA repair protein [Raphidocelis subcapitata]|eukprot:GBF92537.1 DNA repair protein [Raphidocelis subcapitata]